MNNRSIVAAIFDFDGTLIDSDQALIDPFIALGVPLEEISFGHAVSPECDRLGISLTAYVETYDTNAAVPFEGVAEMLGRVNRWAICSNKHQVSANAEMERLGWEPEVAMYADAFGYDHKELTPVLKAMGLGPDQVVMVGDSNGDANCASAVGVQMVWAGWNPRVAAAAPQGIVLGEPAELLELFPGLL